jgi:cytochrome P450
VETKLREEIEKHITTETQINFKNLKEIKYLEWVQLETPRMYGPATSIFLREAVQDTYVDNIPIFKGVGVKMELLPNHYSEKYFKNALKFDPMRWSNP